MTSDNYIQDAINKIILQHHSTTSILMPQKYLGLCKSFNVNIYIYTVEEILNKGKTT